MYIPSDLEVQLVLLDFGYFLALQLVSFFLATDFVKFNSRSSEGISAAQ